METLNPQKKKPNQNHAVYYFNVITQLLGESQCTQKKGYVQYWRPKGLKKNDQPQFQSQPGAVSACFKNKQAEQAAQQIRPLVVLLDELSLTLSAHMVVQLSITPVPGDLLFSSGLLVTRHVCGTDIHVDKIPIHRKKYLKTTNRKIYATLQLNAYELSMSQFYTHLPSKYLKA